MRTRAVRMIVSIVAVVCRADGPARAPSSRRVHLASEQHNLDVQAQLILQNIERRRAWGRGMTPQPWRRSWRIK